ncbi:hypothetical protein [Streptodolium elevatio]|uniref:Uncharacterized protein n=1 Tax=Streptodolium elevatio TaxID=3157996 RepID=A0ABV3DLI8_9ACTN
MVYKIPPLTREELAAERDANPRPADCETCQSGTPVEHWPSTVGCRSSWRRGDDGIERVSRTHCTCDFCF